MLSIFPILLVAMGYSLFFILIRQLLFQGFTFYFDTLNIQFNGVGLVAFFLNPVVSILYTLIYLQSSSLLPIEGDE